jgi:hypothetical protein
MLPIKTPIPCTDGPATVPESRPPRLLARLRVLTMVLVAAAAVVALAPAPAEARGRAIWVNSGYGCSDRRGRFTTSRSRPLCTMTRAAWVAQAGDYVRVARGRYRGPVTPRRSGTPRNPIRWIGGPGVVIDASGRRSGISVMAKHDHAFDGFTVTKSTRQGVWVDRSARITFTRLTSVANKSAGMQIRRSKSITVRNSDISRNAGAGIQELGGVSHSAYLSSRISGNGKSKWSFNGDGLQLTGVAGIVKGNRIEGNGNNPTWEHGIYIGTGARRYLIEGNRLRSNAAANIKAQGSGTIRYNKIAGSKLAIYVGRNTGIGVAIQYNAARGTYNDAVVVGSGGRARMWNNTFANVGGHGKQPTALLVHNAKTLDLRNNLLVAKAPTGRALSIPAPGQLDTLKANNNWYTTPATSQPTVWGGESLSISEWQQRTHQDTASLVSPPPALTVDAKVTSANLGKGEGADLNLTRDVQDHPVPGASPDIGAYET